MILPETIIRIDDGAEFVLNKKTKLYSLKMMLPYKKKGHLIGEFSYKVLSNSKFFKVKRTLKEIKKSLESDGYFCHSECQGWHDDVLLYYYRHKSSKSEVIVSLNLDGMECKIYTNEG